MITKSIAFAFTSALLIAMPAHARAQSSSTPLITAEERNADLSDRISQAPGEGVIPGISDRNAMPALLYSLEAQPVDQFSELIQRQYIHGSNSTFVKWTFKQGAVVGLHYHPYEQVSWIVSGRAEVFSNGKKFIAEAGDILVFPPNVPHEFRMLEDTVNIDFFAPGRQDWMDRDDRYLPK